MPVEPVTICDQIHCQEEGGYFQRLMENLHRSSRSPPHSDCRLPHFIIGPSRSAEDLTRYGILTMMSEIVLLPVVKRIAQRSSVAVLIPQDISATVVPPFDFRPDVIGWRSG